MGIATYEFDGFPGIGNEGLCFAWGTDQSGTPDSYIKAWTSADSWTKASAWVWIGQYFQDMGGPPPYDRFGVFRGAVAWLVDAGYPGPVNPVITQAQVAVMIKADESDDNFDLQLCRCDWSAYQPCDLWTAENVYDLIVAAATEVTILNTAGKALDTWYYSPNFPSLTYINAMTFNIGDLLFYGFRSEPDYDQSEPANYERIQLYSNVKLKIWYEEEEVVAGGPRGYVIG